MRRGFTLIELLVSVAIFAGLVVIMMATFARSTNALTATSGLREKSQIARSTIDSIGNDFRYLYLKNDQGTPTAFRWGNDGTNGQADHYGFAVNSIGDEAYLLLRYPGDAKFTFKHYTIGSFGSPPRSTLTLEEGRNCQLDAGTRQVVTNQNGNCTPATSDLLSSKWILDTIGSKRSSFIETAITPTKAGLLTIGLTILSKDFAQLSCDNSSMPAGECYQTRTSFTQGVK